MQPLASPRVHRLFHGLTAGLLLLAAALTTWWPPAVLSLGALRDPLLAAAMMVVVASVLRCESRLGRLSLRLCLATLSFLATVILAEGFFRLIRFDFRLQQFWLNRTPPYWQKPRVPSGTVFFRRQGNVQWTGQVQKSHLDILGLASDAYANEPVVTLKYDEFGFRNEPRPAEWEIAVAGDSFTELGDLPFTELFTTILGRRLGCRVLNLGVSFAGPLTELSYLQSYGLSPATRQVLIVFFEGNDLSDLAEERVAEQVYEASGQRGNRNLQPQTSVLKALGELIGRRPQPAKLEGPSIDAYFTGRDGEVPVTLVYAVEGRRDLLPASWTALDSFFGRYAEFGRGHRVRTWLAYMPCKERVLHGMMRFTDRAPDFVRTWQPSDLPQVIADFCQTNGIGFIDLTPALVRFTRQEGELVFNSLYDSHLNVRGSQIVAETLVRALRGVPLTTPTVASPARREPDFPPPSPIDSASSLRSGRPGKD